MGLKSPSSFFKKVIPLGNADWILIGKYQEIKASTLMKFIFGLTDSLKNDLIAGNINALDSWIIRIQTFCNVLF
jgi:uncharacterized pyridoxal phosphate-containing UPF0001 family protein